MFHGSPHPWLTSYILICSDKRPRENHRNIIMAIKGLDMWMDMLLQAGSDVIHKVSNEALVPSMKRPTSLQIRSLLETPPIFLLEDSFIFR